MRIKNFVVLIVLYQLVVSICVVHTAFFVWLIRKFVALDGWILNTVVGVIFLALLIFNCCYHVPDLKAHALGLPPDFNKLPKGAVYFDLFSGAMLVTFFIMAFVERFFPLVGAPYFFVAGGVFLIICVVFWTRAKAQRSHSG